MTWQRTAQGIEASADSALTYVFSPVPDEGPSDWADRAVAATHAPVTNTSSILTRGAGEVTQLLRWQGANSSSVTAVLPHQRALLGSDVKAVAGHYEPARGQLTLVQADHLALTYPLPGLLPGVPQIPLTTANLSALQADLTSDLAVPNSEDAGSYYGPKALARLATMLRIADRIGDSAAASAILAKLRPRVVDWLTYTGPADKHWLAYDNVWGGVIAHPSEFGNADFYNDHQFHYGYLIAAAAAVAEADRSSRQATARLSTCSSMTCQEPRAGAQRRPPSHRFGSSRPTRDTRSRRASLPVRTATTRSRRAKR